MSDSLEVAIIRTVSMFKAIVILHTWTEGIKLSLEVRMPPFIRTLCKSTFKVVVYACCDIVGVQNYLADEDASFNQDTVSLLIECMIWQQYKTTSLLAKIPALMRCMFISNFKGYCNGESDILHTYCTVLSLALSRSGFDCKILMITNCEFF